MQISHICTSEAFVAENLQVIHKFERLLLKQMYPLIIIVVMYQYQDQFNRLN